jgi:feruloyl esterase
MPFTDEKLASLLNATDPNLKPFQAHGGKLILYHGWTDPSVSPLETIDYYKSVVATATGAGAFGDGTEAFLHGVNQTEQFIRLFIVPGMDHCGGGPGPNTFEAFGSLVNWVEHKQAPGKMIASHLTAGQVDRMRPLCPYPMTSQYTGQGSTDDAAGFVCKLPAAGSSF